jgi:hypothetical protein
LLSWSGALTTAAIASYVIGCVGLVAVFERLRPTFGRAVALLTTILVFAATSLVWSMTRAGGLPETVAFTLVALGALLLPRLARTGALQPFGWIAIAALPFLVRALPLSSSMPLAAGSDPLFSSDRGLLALTPVAYVGLVGLVLSLRRLSSESIAPPLVVLVWFIAAYVNPGYGSDGRFAHGLSAALALLAPGLATAIDRARQLPWLATATVILGAVVWNYWLMVQYTVGTVPKDAPVSFSDMVRQQADVHTRPPYVYPFALPANAWFAWREGLPLDRYELLASEPRRTELDLTLDHRAAPFLLSGWEAFGAESTDSQVWTREREATLAVPLALSPGRAVDVSVTARARLEEPAVSATIGVVINGREIGRVTVPPLAPVEVALRVGPDVGSLWRAGYNRVTFVSHGVARLDPSDSRPPGPLARRLGNRTWPVAIHRLRIAVANAP